MWRVKHPILFKSTIPGAQLLKQSNPIPEKGWHMVNLYFIDQTRAKKLLSNIGSHETHVFITCHCQGLLQGTFDAVSDKGKVSTFLYQRFSSLVSQHKRRCRKGNITPQIHTHFKGAVAQYHCSRVCEHLTFHLGIHLVPGCVEEPRMQ